MNTDDSLDTVLIDLGSATAETKGGGFVSLDTVQSLDIPAGMSDD